MFEQADRAVDAALLQQRGLYGMHAALSDHRRVDGHLRYRATIHSPVKAVVTGIRFIVLGMRALL